MTDFLLELRSEEIPARMQAGARADLEKLFRKEMQAAGVALGEITVWSTPRRLALIARNLPMATEAVSEEVKGPKTSAPPQALEGFLRKTGLTQEQLTERDGIYFAVSEKPGRATSDVLAEAIPAIIRAFPWPKSQRWGKASISTESLRWVRPLSGIVAILGDDLVACEIDGIRSGYVTKGHRFHGPGASQGKVGTGFPARDATSSKGEITIGSAADYQDKLRACHVIVDHREREATVRDKAKAAAEAAGLVLVEDEGLVIENAGLTEWPVPLLGRFDEAYLDVPPEVIQLTARTNQKYFICRDGAGKLANAFVCTANIMAADGGEAIVAGNRKVLAARLSDARFFWEQDRKKTLDQHAEGLARITFHEKLGTVADKVERVAKLARWLVEEGIVKGADADQAELAARLCKADLVTEMVGEFPELQGLMGGYYARAELDENGKRRFSNEVADAIRDHYKPVGQGDDVPTAPVTVAVSLADKLDTLAQFFVEGLTPTGSKDPFALRRQALAALAMIECNSLRFNLGHVVVLEMALGLGYRAGQSSTADELEVLIGLWNLGVRDNLSAFMSSIKEEQKSSALKNANDVAISSAMKLLDFFADRLKVQQKESGVRHDLIDAVFTLGGEADFVRLLARVHALQEFMASEDGTNLLAGYKRAANILKQAGDTPGSARLELGRETAGDGQRVSTTLDTSGSGFEKVPEEAALLTALDSAEPQAAAAVAAENFAGAMTALASLRAPIDAFFDGVMVNDPDEAKRAFRLGLLTRFRDAVHSVADFSRIEG